MAGPRKSVKVLTDLLTRKQILKQDEDGNIVFRVSGSLVEGHISSSLPITGSGAFFQNVSLNTSGPFSNIAVVTSSLDAFNIYDIDQALHAIDSALATANGPDIQDAYGRLRYSEVGLFDEDGRKTIVLPKTGSSPSETRFPAASVNYVNVSVTVKESGSSGGWLNDLMSVETVVSGASNDEIWIILDAAALDGADSYKLIAVNENPSDYVVT
jgi:hypothetical protein